MNTKILICTILFSFSFSFGIGCLAQESGFRYWTNSEGKQSSVRLKLVDEDDDVVRLAREDNGKVFSFQLSELSDTDTSYVVSRRRQSDTDPIAALRPKSNDRTHFRSDHGESSETGLPTQWSDSQNIQWKTSLPGFGASTPIFVGDRIFVTCYSGYGLSQDSPGDKSNLHRHLVCLARDSGKVLWDTKVESQRETHTYQGFFALHGFASSTPASDGQRVYCLFGNSGVYAFDTESGKELWNAQVGHSRGGFGTSGSVVVHENLVIVNASSESSQMMAFDTRTGKEAWRVQGVNESYGAPVLVKSNGRTEVVVDSKTKLISVDAKSGEPLWTCLGSSPPRYLCPSPIVVDGVIFAIHGHSGPVSALRPGGSGDVTDKRLWNCNVGNTVVSLVHHNGLLFNFTEEGGRMMTIDAKTGEKSREVRLEPRPGRIYGSPLVADEKIYLVSRENGAYVISANAELNVLAHNKIASDESVFNASPVAHAGQLLLRSDKFLYCIGE